MQKLTVPLLVILMFTLSACFKNAASVNPTGEPVSLASNPNIAVDTTQVTPVTTLPVTETATLEVTAEVTEEVTEQALVATATSTATNTIEPSATSTATHTATITLTATSAVSSTPTDIPTRSVGLAGGATFTPIPDGQGGGPDFTETPAGEAQPLGEPTQEVMVAVEPTSTNTLQPTNTLLPSPTNTDIPTNTPEPTSTNTPAPSNTPLPAVNQGVAATGVGPTLTTVPLNVAANINNQAAAPTEEFGQGGAEPIASATTVELAQVPTQTPPAGLTVNQMTATAILQNAAATQSAFQTQQAGGVVQPTADPNLTTTGQTPISVTAAPTVATSDCQYLVQIGETLSQIARRYNLTIEQIANHPNNAIVNPDLIRAGYEITIPGCGQITPTAIPGSTATPIPAGAGGAGATSNSAGPFTYTVVAGDNIYKLSVRYGVTMREILNANPQITNMNVISEGQLITIPGPPTQLTAVPQTNVVQPTVAPTQQVVPQQQIFTPTWTPQGQ